MATQEPIAVGGRLLSAPAPAGSDRPSRHAWLVAVSAGLGYLFDSYVVNIYSLCFR